MKFFLKSFLAFFMPSNGGWGGGGNVGAKLKIKQKGGGKKRDWEEGGIIS